MDGVAGSYSTKSHIYMGNNMHVPTVSWVAVHAGTRPQFKDKLNQLHGWDNSCLVLTSIKWSSNSLSKSKQSNCLMKN